MSKEEQNNQHPPKPPEFIRKFKFNLVQLIGIPIFLIIPVLALFGVFGESADKVRASSAEFEMQVEYPTRFRYKQVNPVEVSLRNTSSQIIPALTVSFDHFYISKFSETQFTPQVKEVIENSYKVELNYIQPGETRRVSVSLQGEHYGRHNGSITAETERGSRADVNISTIIFP